MQQLSMWVIYDHPRDYPDSFVVREFVGTVPSPGVRLHPTLDAARASVPPGLAMLTRCPEDDPTIVEVWL